MSRIYVAVERFAATEERPEGLVGILAIDPDHGDWRLLVERDEVAGSPRLDRGGNRLAFLDGGKDPWLWALGDPWDSAPEPIARLSGYASFAWAGSDDGFFISLLGRDERAGSWRIAADGSDWVRLPLPKDDTIHDCSPDGRWLLVGKGQIEAVRPDGTDRRCLTGPGETDIRPRFSPDGRRIVYVSATQDGESLWITDIDGMGRHQVLPESPVTIVARWASDGSRLALKLCDCVRNDRGMLTVPRDLSESRPRIEIIDADCGDRRPLDLPPGRFVLGDWG